MLYVCLIIVIVIIIGAICYIRSKIDEKEAHVNDADISKYEDIADKHQRK